MCHMIWGSPRRVIIEYVSVYISMNIYMNDTNANNMNDKIIFYVNAKYVGLTNSGGKPAKRGTFVHDGWSKIIDKEGNELYYNRYTQEYSKFDGVDDEPDDGWEDFSGPCANLNRNRMINNGKRYMETRLQLIKYSLDNIETEIIHKDNNDTFAWICIMEKQNIKGYGLKNGKVLQYNPFTN